MEPLGAAGGRPRAVATQPSCARNRRGPYVVGYPHPPLSPSINNNIPQYSPPRLLYALLTLYSCFSVIEAQGARCFRTPCPNCRRSHAHVSAPRPPFTVSHQYYSFSDVQDTFKKIKIGNRLREIVVVQWRRTVTLPEVYLVQKVAGEVQESPRA